MAETVALTTPITYTSTATIRLDRVILDIQSKTIMIQWIDDAGRGFSAVYSTPAPADHPAQPTGATLLTTLNTANLTTTSLVKRVLQRLQVDGYLGAGTISGTPD